MRALSLRGVGKRYPGVVALDGVDLDLDAGEVHALAGENGAGKSTLARIVYGTTVPDAGTIELFGEPYAPRGPRDAMGRGVGLVHQHFMLVDPLTVAENAVLGAEPGRAGALDLAAARRRVEETAERFGLALDPDRHVEDLSVGEKQRLEILKVLLRGARLLLLDEPTAVLAPAESRALFATVERLAEGGATVLFVTHRLGEVVAHARRVTVLRRGRKVATVDAASTDERELARLVVGREPAPPPAPGRAEPGSVVLEVDGAGDPDPGQPGRLKDVSLRVRAGEIVGVAGVEGNGQRELVEAVAGLRPFAGRIEVGGRDVSGLGPAAVRALGVAHIPEDRLAAGVVAPMTVAENLILGRESRFARGARLDRRRLAEHARERITAFDVRPPEPGVPVATLSGGNQQKVVIAREAEGGPALLLAAHPTRGVDVGAAEAVHAALLGFRTRGAAVLLVSSDLAEVRALSDRIVVLYDGRVAGELSRDEADEETLGVLMVGGRGA